MESESSHLVVGMLRRDDALAENPKSQGQCMLIPFFGAIQGGGSAPQASLQPVLPQTKTNYCKFYATKHGNSILSFVLSISSYPLDDEINLVAILKKSA